MLPADENGKSDPYIVASVAGQEIKSAPSHPTREFQHFGT